MNRIPCRSRLAWLCGWTGCLLLLLVPVTQAQETYGKPEDPLAAEALGVQIRTSNPDEMAFIIKQILLVNYVKAQSLEATNSEINQFLARKKEVTARSRKEAEARRDEVEKQLQSQDLPDADRKQLEGEQQFLDAMLKAAQEADKQGNDPKRAAVESQMAKSLIEQWKVSQSVYKKYGGRVVYQQVGAEPLDAYHEFFKSAQKADDFKILNKEFEPAFWSYYTTDSKHRFYPENESDKVINTPWWMMDPKPGQ